MALQQLTGVTFSSSYGTTFYKQVGLGSMAFTYAVRPLSDTWELKN
jgi:MFS transporter, SP family, sugar:H+ symporter